MVASAAAYLALVAVSSPLAVAGECLKFGEVFQSRPELSSFVAALKQAELFESAFNPETPFTAFAPTNDAFAAVADEVAMLAGNLPALQNLLQGHALEFGATSADLEELEGKEVVSHSGEPVLFEINGEGDITVTAANGGTTGVVIAQDLEACGGSVVHIIDAVLVRGDDVTQGGGGYGGDDGAYGA